MKLKNCLVCQKETKLEIVKVDLGYLVKCGRCRKVSGIEPSERKAMLNWNRLSKDRFKMLNVKKEFSHV